MSFTYIALPEEKEDETAGARSTANTLLRVYKSSGETHFVALRDLDIGVSSPDDIATYLASNVVRIFPSTKPNASSERQCRQQDAETPSPTAQHKKRVVLHSLVPESVSSKSVYRVSDNLCRLSRMPTFLDQLQSSTRLGGAEVIDVPVAFSHHELFTTSMNQLRHNLVQSRDRLETGERIPFTEARNSLPLSFAMPLFVTPTVREVSERCGSQAAEKLPPSAGRPKYWISSLETARLEELAHTSQTFVFGGPHATSGIVRPDTFLLGAWMRVLDGALRLTIRRPNSTYEELILVGGGPGKEVGDVAVVMLGLEYCVTACPVPEGALKRDSSNTKRTDERLAEGAVLFTRGLVPMTRFYSQEELSKHGNAPLTR